MGKVPRKILQENPRENPPKFIQQKSRHISAEGLGQHGARRAPAGQDQVRFDKCNNLMKSPPKG